MENASFWCSREAVHLVANGHRRPFNRRTHLQMLRQIPRRATQSRGSSKHLQSKITFRVTKRNEEKKREPGHARVTNLLLVEAGEPHGSTCRHRDGREKADSGRLCRINLSHGKIGPVVRNRSRMLTSSCQDLDGAMMSYRRSACRFPANFHLTSSWCSDTSSEWSNGAARERRWGEREILLL